MSWKYEYMHQDIIMEPPLRACNKLLLVDQLGTSYQSSQLDVQFQAFRSGLNRVSTSYSALSNSSELCYSVWWLKHKIVLQSANTSIDIVIMLLKYFLCPATRPRLNMDHLSVTKTSQLSHFVVHSLNCAAEIQTQISGCLRYTTDCIADIRSTQICFPILRDRTTSTENPGNASVMRYIGKAILLLGRPDTLISKSCSCHSTSRKTSE